MATPYVALLALVWFCDFTKIIWQLYVIFLCVILVCEKYN